MTVHAFEAAKILSIVSFLSYGLACLFSTHMMAEFERFGLSRYRRWTGAVEVLGALGLTAGIFIPPLTIAASAGLSLLMAIGAGVRLRIGDSLRQTFPALFFLMLNLFIFLRSLGKM